MCSEPPSPSYSSSVDHPRTLVGRHPVVVYFLLTFAISWSAALSVASPYLVRHEPLPKITGILMFPAMLLGPSLSAIIMTKLVDGGKGLRALFSRMSPIGLPARWYATLLIPPLLVLTVLFCLRSNVSAAYSPNFFLAGVLFGVPAGFLEEIGWSGFAFSRMRTPANALVPAILLGVLWSIWHLPVINYLGAATPHGAYWIPFFLAFALAMTAMRTLICWIYVNTGSVWLAQLMHVTSTGSLVVFGASRVTAEQEAVWYAAYGFLLWVAVAIVTAVWGKTLARQSLFA